MPRTAVCIPTFNAERWIRGTLESVLSQGINVEVVVSDDASSDATVDLARSTGDPRVRVEASAVRLGMARNWNRAVQLSDSEHVKVLMQDDVLLPGSLAVQVDLLDKHPSAAFAFGPRILESDGSRAADAWLDKYRAPHEAFGEPRELMHGPAVAAILTRRRLRANAIGEPSVVLMRRRAFDRAGGFDASLGQLTDLDLWIRLAAAGDVAFDGRPVVLLRVHAGSATARNQRTGRAWLDRMRIVRSLRSNPDTRHLVGATHYLAAVGAGSIELGRALLMRARDQEQ